MLSRAVAACLPNPENIIVLQQSVRGGECEATGDKASSYINEFSHIYPTEKGIWTYGLEFGVVLGATPHRARDDNPPSLVIDPRPSADGRHALLPTGDYPARQRTVLLPHLRSPTNALQQVLLLLRFYELPGTVRCIIESHLRVSA